MSYSFIILPLSYLYSGTDLISLLSPVTQQAFSEASKQVVVDLRSMTNEHHLLVGVKDEMTSKKTPEKRSMKKIVKKVVVG